MEKTTVDVELSGKLYREMDEVCEDLGMSVEDAFQIFARKMVNEQGIPFEVTEKEYPIDEKKNLVQKIIEIAAAAAAAAGLAALIHCLIRRFIRR